MEDGGEGGEDGIEESRREREWQVESEAGQVGELADVSKYEIEGPLGVLRGQAKCDGIVVGAGPRSAGLTFQLKQREVLILAQVEAKVDLKFFRW